MSTVANRLQRSDPRHTQIAILLSLCTAGVFAYPVDLQLSQLVISVGLALLCEWGFSRCRNQRFDFRSPLITGLSLSLLLRMNQPYWACAAAMLAISSKYLIRIRGRHVFNPANAAIVFLLLADVPIWVSPGQWGGGMVLVFALSVFGMAVLLQTRQWDIAFAFLAIYALLLLARALYLGDVLAIPLHQLNSGTLLIFAFFMLSDPKTIPASWRARAVFAAVVAVLAFVLRFNWYMPEAIFYALFMASIGRGLLNYAYQKP